MKREVKSSGDVRSGSEIAPRPSLKVADEVWIVAALLHREHPDREDFSIEEILGRAKQEKLTESVRPGIYVHILQHCVANRPPNPARYRMLYETGSGRRRLFRTGDGFHPGRAGGKTEPRAEDLPPAYVDLLGWYGEWCATAARVAPGIDPLLELAGSGRDLWAGEHGDEYVRRLREGWQ